MKKLKYTIIFIISLFIYSTNVSAATANIIVNPATPTSGEKITITATIQNVAAWNVELKATGQVEDNCSKKFAAETEDAQNTNKVLTLTCTATQDGNINISLTGDATSADNVTSNVSATKMVTVHTPSGDTSLKTFTINGQNISDGGKYNAGKNGSIDIIAVANNEKASVTGTGTHSLNYGDNTFKVTVTAENGATKTYTITVSRDDDRDKDNTLSSLTVSKGSLNFKSSTVNYVVNVDTDVTSIEINAKASSSKASVTGTGTKNLKIGNNYFKITVTAENGATNEYNIRVVRKDNRSDNNTLKSITPSSGKLKFDSAKTDFSVIVDYEVDKISFKAETEDSKAEIISGLEEKELVVGENVLEIKVKAENESVKTYKITVVRNKEVIETNENKAKSIIIKNHNIDFNPDVTEYELETRLHDLDITVELNSPTSSYEITGNEDLHDGSVIQITIIDKDGNNNIYSIKISNPNETLEDKSFFDMPIFKLPKIVYYSIIFVSIIILLILSLLVYNQKNNIRKMLKKNEHHHNHDSIDYKALADSGLTGEPTYETLEMAKIDLEDYLTEEKKAKRRKGIKQTPEEIDNMRDELEAKIALLEDAETTLDEIKKTKEEIKEEEELSPINLEELGITTKETKETKTKQTRSGRKSSKKLDLIDIDGLTSEPEIKDDIDDLINATREVEEPSIKPIKTRSSRTKKTLEETKESEETKEKNNTKEQEKETLKTTDETISSNSSSKKKKKKKKNTSKTKKEDKDELLDSILSKQYTKKEK